MEWHMGEILRVDLSSREIRREPVPGQLYEDFLGGWGINVKLSYDLVKSGVPPLSPETPIIISSGFLAGTPCPGTPKVFMTTKCPSSGTVSTAVGGLHFGSRLMWAGYEHLIITGRAERPVYLKIEDEDVEICDAGQIWGKDLYEATDWLREKHGSEFSTVAIGPAGENLVNISIALIDKGSTFGRTFGGSLGSKNLKAIVVKGTRGRRVADERGFNKTVQRLVEKGMQDPIRDKWRKLAIHLPFAMWEEAGTFQQSNYAETVNKEEFTALYGPEAYLKIKRSSYCCPSCLTGDKAVVEFKEGEFAGLVAPFSTPLVPLSCFGGRNAVGGIDKGYKCGDLANRYGIDICTFSGLLGFVVELYERGIITKADTDGFEPKNDFETVVQLMEMTTRKEGMGDILGAGFKGAMRRIDRGCEKYACQIKGTETDFDARVSLGVEAFTAVVNPRPSHDMPIGGLTVAKGRKPEFFEKVVSKTGYVPEEAKERVFPPSGFDLGRLTAHYENWAALLNSMGICFRMQVSALYNVNTCAELYSMVTGIIKSPEDMLKGAERSFHIYKAANVREGFSRKDDRFPDRWFEPLRRPDRGTEITMKDYFGTKTITREDTERMLDAYYEERGWDIDKGIPTRRKLEALDLEDVAEDLEDLGMLP